MRAVPLPEGWRIVRLGEVATHCLGKMLDAQKNKGRPRQYLRNPNVRWFEVDTTDLREMPFEDHELERYRLDEGDVVICEGGEAGRAAIWDGRLPGMMIQKAIHRVRTGPELDNRFLVHRLFFDYHSGRLSDYYTGATIKHLTGQDLARYEFPLPPLDEQRRIVAILDKIDAIRRKREAALRLYAEFAKARFLELFGDLEENLASWPVRPLEEVADIASGVTKGRKFDGQETVCVPYLRVANVQDGYLNLAEIKEVEVLPADVMKYRLEDGDVVLTEGGDPDKLGRGAVWRAQIDCCIHQNHIFRVRTRRELLFPEYLSALTGSVYGKKYFLRSAKQTTGIASINMTQLKAFPVVLAPIELQSRFIAFQKAVQERVARLELSKAELERLAQVLRTQLLDSCARSNLVHASSK